MLGASGWAYFNISINKGQTSSWFGMTSDRLLRLNIVGNHVELGKIWKTLSVHTGTVTVFQFRRLSVGRVTSNSSNRSRTEMLILRTLRWVTCHLQSTTNVFWSLLEFLKNSFSSESKLWDNVPVPLTARKEFKLWLKNKIKHDFNFQQNSLSIIKTMTAIISVTYNK